MTVAQITRLIQTLRGEGGCPWDRKQTPETLCTYLIEESYELVEAISNGQIDAIQNELGDVLFQVLFIAELFRERGAFELDQVVSENLQKMERRHPHVFGDVKVHSVLDVKNNWDKIKAKEKKDGAPHDEPFHGVPPSMPALMRAYRISERAAGKGFDWDNVDGVMAKVEEELQELKAALQKRNNRQERNLEFGDLLFTLVNVARFSGIHPEEALRESIKKFEKRYGCMMRKVSEKGLAFDAMSQEQKDFFWEMAKRETENIE